MSTLDQADVCIVGAGIVGLAHALECRRRGLRVALCERDDRAAGASVRNFGHLIISAMGDGLAFDCALASRERWLELGSRAGLDVEQGGSLIVARHADEMELLSAFVRDERRGARLVDPGELARLAPIPIAGVLGGVHAELDLRVDPRAAASALARLLENDPGAGVHWRTAAQAVDRGGVQTSRGTIRADAVVVCPGPDLDTLFPDSLATVTRCALQMLRVAAPQGHRYRPALLTGLSLLRYPAFREADPPLHARIAARVATESPALAAAGVHLIVTQRTDGDLILGDTHAYATTVDPFRDEALDELLLALARELLGASELPVRERWQGVYPVIPGETFHVVSPAPRVRVVEVVSGIGMTTSFGLAEHVLDGLLATG